MKKILFTLSFFVIAFFASAQKEANIWYFGSNAGLDFNSGSPVALTNGALNTSEGCSSICDANGNLLFYTDGSTIWNRNNQPMANGTGLTGNTTATQSAMIVKQPGIANIYYVFTTYTTLNYSVVDMTLNGGLGDVTSAKNVFMINSAEKLCGTKAANGTDVWVMMHEANTNGFNAFLLTATGVNLTPVHSNAGPVTSSANGQMKFSVKGDKIAFGLVGSPQVNICNFDNSSGMVSLQVSITYASYNQCYGLEFSPDGSRLYASVHPGANFIYQYDLTAGSDSAIIASQTQITGNPSSIMAGMQLGPDGKIYISPMGSSYVDAIDNPNALGAACNYTTNAVYLAGETSQLGLPEYVSSFFLPVKISTIKANFQASDTAICNHSCISFSDLSTDTPTAWQWVFTGADSATSLMQNPVNICYNSPGYYPVTLIASNSSGSDTLTVPNAIHVYLNASAGTLTSSRDSICIGSGITSTLTDTNSVGNIQWQSSVTGTDFTDIPAATSTNYTTPQALAQTTYYRVVAQNAFCKPDTSLGVAVHILPEPVAEFNFTVNGSQVKFNSDSSSSDVISYSWTFGDATTSNAANPTHTYAATDTFNVCLTVYNGSNCSYTLCKDVYLIFTGVENAPGLASVSLYPNPAGEKLFVIGYQLLGNKIEVTDVLGRSLLMQNIPSQTKQTTIDVSRLTAGVYFITLHTANGEVVRKFVKE